MSGEQAYTELAVNWLQLAESDFQLAQIARAEEFYPQSCFLCQQVAEKALKAYLFAQHQPLVRSHVLPRLQFLSEQFDPEFKQLNEACSILTEYYIDTRYPDIATALTTFDEETAREALQLTQLVVAFVGERVQRLVGEERTNGKE